MFGVYTAKPETDNSWEQTKNTVNATSNGSEETIKEDADAIDKTIEDGTNAVKSGFGKARDKLNKGAGAIKDGITQSVSSMRKAHCVKAAGGDEIMTDTTMWNDIKERIDSTIEASKDLPFVNMDGDKSTDVKARADSTLEASKEFPCVDMEAEKACGSGFEATADGMDNVNEFDTSWEQTKNTAKATTDGSEETIKEDAEAIDKTIEAGTNAVKSGFDKAWDKLNKGAGVVKDGITQSVGSMGNAHSVKAVGVDEIMTDTKMWDDIKERADSTIEASKDFVGVQIDGDKSTDVPNDIKASASSTLEASKEFPCVDTEAEKACGSGFEATADGMDNVNEATKFPTEKSINPVKETTTATESVDIKDTEDDGEIETKLKGIESGLANFRNAATTTWEDIKARTDATLKASEEFPGVDIHAVKGSGFEAASDGTDDVNTILNGKGDREDDANLTEKTFDPVKEGVNKTWDAVFPNVDAEPPESNEDVVGSGENNTNQDDTSNALKGITNSINEASTNCKSATAKLSDSLSDSSEISAWKKTKSFTIDAANSTADAIENGYDAVVDGAGNAWNSTVGFLGHGWKGNTKVNDVVDNTNEEIEGDKRNETSKASETTPKFDTIGILPENLKLED